ncbi:tRNA(Phe) (4-demethylwyosine(37)-C(7)) aminocarboxypropyltransferase [uncultured archaeon]|nr:tRNA(Phe) (4-demethylwyosine(37)-C(7)) aminocarboxypropyltransferase [uncultured archaeon]
MSRATVQRDDEHQQSFLAALVSRGEAKVAIEEISSSGLLDSSRKVLTSGSLVEIPVIKAPLAYQTVAQEHPEFFKGSPELADLLKSQMNPYQLEHLPRGWFILGDIIIVKIQPQLERFKHRIGDALLSIYPRCKSVLRDFGIEGPLREPVREIIAGESSETVHRENGVLFKLDALRVMFSQGNLRERMRMSLLGRDEVIVDMFAGIGYFALPMAVHAKPKRVLAIEINPVAYGYLKENVCLNHAESIVEPVFGDCQDATPQGVADRVVMGYVGSTDRYLRTGVQALRPGGVLHYHQTIPSKKYPDYAIKDIVEAAEKLDKRVEILNFARVKKYSPGVVHAVVDARIG